MKDHHAAVIGTGAMGAGIAQVLATAGWHVALHDTVEGAAEAARERIAASLEKAVAADRMTASGAATVLGRLRVAPALADAAQDAALVVEAVVEELGVKQALFADLDRLVQPDAVLATNTSSFQVAEVAQGTRHPERVIGLHFFFPAHANRLVEVVATPASYDAAKRAHGWMADAGKVPVMVSDAHGFCVNRFLVPMVNEGFRLLDEDVADAATIEAAGRAAFDAPFGPFGIYDLSGPVVTTHAQETLHRAHGAFYEPAPSMREHALHDRRVGAEPGPSAGATPAPGPDASSDADPTALAAAITRLQGVVYGVACHLVAEGVASEEDTDLAARTGLRWGRGPFEAMAADPAGAAAAVLGLHEQWGEAFPLPARFA